MYLQLVAVRKVCIWGCQLERGMHMKDCAANVATTGIHTTWGISTPRPDILHLSRLGQAPPWVHARMTSKSPFDMDSRANTLCPTHSVVASIRHCSHASARNLLAPW